MAAHAPLDPIARSLQQSLHRTAAIGRQRGADGRLNNQDPAGTRVRTMIQQPRQSGQVAGLRGQQQVAVVGRTTAGADHADLFIAVPAEPEQGGQGGRTRDMDAAGGIDAGLGEKIAQDIAERRKGGNGGWMHGNRPKGLPSAPGGMPQGARPMSGR